MRKLIAVTQLTVDGVMQAPGAPEEDTRHGFTHGGWAMPFVDDELRRVEDGIMAEDFDLLLGRRTYDIFAGFWPQQHDTIGDAFNKSTKYAVTSRATGLGWKTTEQVTGNVADEIRQLKASDGRTLHVWGSGKLLQALIAADLVDEYRLWVFPVVLGYGQRLFENGMPPHGLSLIASQGTPSGVVISTYRPAGAVRTV